MNTPQILINNAKQYPNEPAISIKDANGEWKTDNWTEFFDYTMQISKSLISLGIGPNEKISIYSYNRKEWYGCYLASQMSHIVGVGVYHTCSSEEVEWVVGNSESRIVFVGNNPNDNDDVEKMPNHRLLNVIDKLNLVDVVVMMDGIDTLNH